MDRHDIAELGRSLPDCLDKGTDAHPEWYVDGWLVARLEDADTLVVHLPVDDRDHFVGGLPAIFSGDDHGDDPAVRASLSAAERDPRGRDAVRLAFRAAYALRRPPLEQT